MTRNGDDGSVSVDPTAVTRVLQDHPVQVGVLFGSHARGTATSESDVDVAVEFDDALSTEKRHQARIDLIVDLMERLGVNDVDVTDLEGVRPAVGASALRTGVVLIGRQSRVDRLREDFESRTTERTHNERMQQFDELLERLEEAM